MDSIHDLGGMHGFGAVPIENEGYTFKDTWQRRAFGLTQSLAGTVPFCADMHRKKIEQLAAVDYLQLDYFEKWTIATTELMKDSGLVNDAELASGKKQFDVNQERHPPVSSVDLVDAMKTGGTYTFPDGSRHPKFFVGDQIKVRSNCAEGHTRVPRYVRSKAGIIRNIEGIFQFADSVANGMGPDPQPCYLVEFNAAEVWGQDAEATDDLLYLDLAESYLEHA